MFEFKPDYEQVRRRMDAWWECAVTDRTLTSITFPKPEDERVPVPRKEHDSLRERWLDSEYNAERAYATAANTVYYADALPVKFPNLGPEVFSAFYGCELEYGENTAWSVPMLEEWDPETVSQLSVDTDSFYFRKLVEMTDAYLERAKGKFIVGYTDLHPGGDAVAAFRDPAKLCLDMVERPGEVKELVERVTDDFIEVFDFFYEKLSAAGMPSSSWLPLTCDGRFHIPSNDFSCMISMDMFTDVFLPGIERECAHMDRCIYHLDGPQALRYLDLLLDEPDIHAIQWVAGAGQSAWHQWIDVYQRIQEKRKAFVVYLPVDELDQLFEHLRPEGAWLSVGGIQDREQADRALEKIENWGMRP
jgi:hypothetical protein